MIAVFINVLNPAPHVALRNYLSADNFAFNKSSKQILSIVFVCVHVCVCDVGRKTAHITRTPTETANSTEQEAKSNIGTVKFCLPQIGIVCVCTYVCMCVCVYVGRWELQWGLTLV